MHCQCLSLSAWGGNIQSVTGSVLQAADIARHWFCEARQPFEACVSKPHTCSFTNTQFLQQDAYGVTRQGIFSSAGSQHAGGAVSVFSILMSAKCPGKLVLETSCYVGIYLACFVTHKMSCAMMQAVRCYLCTECDWCCRIGREASAQADQQESRGPTKHCIGCQVSRKLHNSASLQLLLSAMFGQPLLHQARLAENDVQGSQCL